MLHVEIADLQQFSDSITFFTISPVRIGNLQFFKYMLRYFFEMILTAVPYYCFDFKMAAIWTNVDVKKIMMC